MAVEIAAERPDSPDAEQLILELEAHLEPRYPAASRHGYSVRRLVEEGVDFFVLRSDDRAAACGGVLIVPPTTTTSATARSSGCTSGRRSAEPGSVGRSSSDSGSGRASEASRLLRLETGIHQVEAIGLYEQAGFRAIRPFGPYVDDPLSRCFERRLA